VLLGLSGAARADIPTTLVFPTFQHSWGIRKATSTHLFMFVGLRTRFDNPQGLACVRLEAWEDDTTEDDDDELVVYGINSGPGNIIWNSSMYSVKVFGEQGEAAGQFRDPRGIAADPGGNVWVADTGNDRLVHLYNPGRSLVWKKVVGSRGPGPGQFRSPTGVALDSRGTLYVTDTENSRIQVFDQAGRYQREIAEGLDRPRQIAVLDADERWSYHRDAFLCVSDSGGRRLVKLSPRGEILAYADLTQTEWPRAHFGYIAIDYYGNIWVSDRENHCLHKFDRQLNYVVSFGKEGGGDREFRSPRGIAIWKRFGQVFVAEEAGAQYYWVGVDVLDVEVDRDVHTGGFDITFLLTERAFVTVEILDGGGRRVGALAVQKQEPVGRHRYAWDGRAPGGGTLKAGRYTIRITAEPTYSSYHYFQKVIERQIRL
jgi:DNA-binding beta-propeller fold protein YncE